MREGAEFDSSSSQELKLFPAGQRLREIRKRLGLTMRDVEHATLKIAKQHKNVEYWVPPSRLSDLETKGITPGIYRFYSLAAVYRQNVAELLLLFGIDFGRMVEDVNKSVPGTSRICEGLACIPSINLPSWLDPNFDSVRTCNFSRMIGKWSAVPMTYLEQFARHKFTYGYIGSSDYTMYPLLPPGTFVQVDESRNGVAKGGWQSEYERPVYFVETRQGHTCCWCDLYQDDIILQPHPQSPVAARVLHCPQQAEVIGQIVGVAMRFADRATRRDFTR